MLRSQTLIQTALRMPVSMVSFPRRVLLVIAMSTGAATIGGAQGAPARVGAGVESCASLSADARESATVRIDTTGGRVDDAALYASVSTAAPVACERQDEQGGAGGRFVPRPASHGRFRDGAGGRCRLERGVRIRTDPA